MNDGMIVSVWQDVFMKEPPEQHPAEAEPDPPAVRTVDDVDMLKAMADPTRLAILAALMKPGLPVMSVKELAAKLGEPQTKLYRHVKQLEAAGLIRVAGTRLVSGILEQRYQACQRDLTLARGFLYEHADESELVMEAVLERYFEGFRAAFRADQRPGNEIPADEPYRKPVLFYSDAKLSPAQAAELVSKLKEIMDSLKEAKDPESVTLNLLIGSYVPVDPGGG
jgi:DNA-binding transcriptional ArsR family regulator